MLKEKRPVEHFGWTQIRIVVCKFMNCIWYKTARWKYTDTFFKMAGWKKLRQHRKFKDWLIPSLKTIDFISNIEPEPALYRQKNVEQKFTVSLHGVNHLSKWPGKTSAFKMDPDHVAKTDFLCVKMRNEI